MTLTILTDVEMAAALGDLPQWHHSAGALRRTYRTQNWKGTMLLVATIGHLAEVAWHHPELVVTYGKVEIALNTHDAGGITALDVALARKIEAVMGWDPKGDGLPGTPTGSADAYLKQNSHG